MKLEKCLFLRYQSMGFGRVGAEQLHCALSRLISPASTFGTRADLQIPRSLLTTVLFLCIVVLLAGCATKVPMATSAEDRLAKHLDVPSGKGVVFVLRDHGTVGAALRFAVSVDETVIGWSAPGTYYKLVLDPGWHNFHTFHPKKFNYLGIAVEAGKNHFILANHFPLTNEWLAEIPEVEGLKALSSSQLAKFDTRNLSLWKVKADPQITPEGLAARPAKQSVESPPTSAPSDSQLSKFLEGLAVAFLVGVAIVGYAAASSQGVNLPIPDTSPSRYADVAIVQPEMPKAGRVRGRGRDTNTYLTTSGDLYYVSDDKIYSPTRATQWTVSGNNIRGTDGSSYRVDGDRIYSSSGLSYKVQGNNLVGTDGSICSVTGTLVNCR